MNAADIARRFFDTYTRALLDRDATAIADMYAVPALIEFPGQPIAVSDRAQTAEFFASAVAQYSQVTETDATITIAASAPHSIWADVVWDHHGDAPTERMMYQLIVLDPADPADPSWRIAVLTPLEV
jgi:hypothetical protein